MSCSDCQVAVPGWHQRLEDIRCMGFHVQVFKSLGHGPGCIEIIHDYSGKAFVRRGTDMFLIVRELLKLATKYIDSKECKAAVDRAFTIDISDMSGRTKRVKAGKLRLD